MTLEKIIELFKDKSDIDILKNLFEIVNISYLHIDNKIKIDKYVFSFKSTGEFIELTTIEGECEDGACI